MLVSGCLNKELNANKKNILVVKAFYDYTGFDYYRKKHHISGTNIQETDRDKISRFNNYLKRYFTDTTVNDINKEMLIDITEYIKELDNRNGDQISEALQYRLWTDFKAFLNYLFDMELVNQPFIIPLAAGIPKPKKKKIIQCWHRKEYEKFIQNIDIEIEKTFFRLLGEGGPRKSEARGVRFKNINFNTNEIEIYTQLKNKEEGDVKTKTEYSRRIIKVNNAIIERIKEHMNDRKKTGIDENELLEQYVFVDQKNNVFSNETLRRHYKKYVEAAGVKYYPIHYLRHYYGTQAIMNGLPVPVVQDQMGHSRSDNTVLVYYVQHAEREKNYE